MKRAASLILLLFTLSGISGLIYEIIWIRILSHLLGGTTYAISTVLAAFMGGLALGSRFFGKHADRTLRPLRLYALLEVGIAVLGVLVYVIIMMAPPAYVRLAHIMPGSALGILRVLISFLLIVPPTFLMGGTLPVLSRVIVQDRERLGRGLGLLYAVNTFGAVLGCFLTGFVLIAALGHTWSTALAVLINLIIALAVWIIDRGLPSQEPPSAQPGPGPDTPDKEQTGEPAGKKAGRKQPAAAKAKAPLPAAAGFNLTLLAVIFALSGFASLGYELYWTRGLKHFLGNSTHAFSAMLTTFLLGLAVGGWLGGRLADRVKSPSHLLGWIQLAIGASAMLTLLLIWEGLPRLEDIRFFTSQRLDWNTYLLRRFLAAALVMVVPTVLTGMTFPVVNRIGIRSLARMGRGVGHLYFSNTLGAILGSLAAGFLVLPLLGVKMALLATGVLSAALGLLAHLGSRPRRHRELYAAMLVFAVLVVLMPVLRNTGQSLFSDTQEAEDRVIFEREDHAGETRVYRKASTNEIHMSVDGHHIGGTEPVILRKEKILAHLPMMLFPEAKKTLSIGLGSGITLGTLALYEEIEDLSCVEIVPGVVEGAGYFRQAHGDVLSDPRVHVHVGDGIQYLLTTDQRYDIISSDSKLNPMFAGNAPLLSRDYYQLCHDRLTAGGVMVQWLAVHFPNAEMEMVIRSFLHVFPQAALYWLDSSSIVLAGSKAPLRLDMDAVRDFAERDKPGDDLAELQLDNPYIAANMFVAGRSRLEEKLGVGPINTWQRPRLEFILAREFLRKSVSRHEDENFNWLLRLRDLGGQHLSGEYNPETLSRFDQSSVKLLEAFAAGGGAMRLETGTAKLMEGIELNPDDHRLSNYLATVQGSVADLEQALEDGQIRDEARLVHLGLNRLDAGRYREALALFDKAAELRPDDANIKYNRLLALKRTATPGEFRSELESFVNEFPRDARGHSMLGRLQAEAGRFDSAQEEFQKALELDPQNHVFMNNLATVMAQLERWEEAGRLFAQVSELRSNFQSSAYFAAASYSQAGMFEETARWMKLCLDEGYATADQFTESEFFVKFRASEYWDSGLLENR